MTDRVWLASYPKSGNTWFRMLVGCLALHDGETLDVNKTTHPGGIASSRPSFDYATLLDSGLLTHDEVDALRPAVYEHLTKTLEREMDAELVSAVGPRFVKVHDAYTRSADGEPLLAARRGASCALLIVRDPRDLPASMANHNRSTIDHAIGVMNDPAATFCAGSRRQYPQLRQRLLSWSAHAASWLDQTDIPIHLVRYEALRRDTPGVFARAMTFVGHPITAAEAERAAQLSSFSNLQAQEKDKGFRERVGAGPFFRRGQAEAWRDELTPPQILRIEEAHRPMMERLGYELSAIGAPRESVPRVGEGSYDQQET